LRILACASRKTALASMRRDACAHLRVAWCDIDDRDHRDVPHAPRPHRAISRKRRCDAVFAMPRRSRAARRNACADALSRSHRVVVDVAAKKISRQVIDSTMSRD
jgi:hypothetical protein